MSRPIRWLLAILIAITAISIASAVYVSANHSDTDEDEQEAVKTPSHVFEQNGVTIITLDPATQAREGIRVEPLKETASHDELRANAILLPVNDLATLRNAYVAAQTKLNRDKVDLSISQSQYERTRTLYGENQNMSLMAMQTAEAAYRNNQAQVTADQQDSKLQLDTIRQRWGDAVAKWVSDGSPTLDAVLEQSEFLAQVVFPPGEVANAPATLTLTAPRNTLIRARLVSPLPQVNPQIQGISFLYLVSNHLGMAVSMNLSVQVPVGRAMKGAIVPESAIVWWQGKAWVYVATSSRTFSRREISTANRVSRGYFVPSPAFKPGTKLATAGAQALLSEEFRSQIQQED
ncbi:MAG TPA: hypothetical protein VGS78_01750 [Candidatus Sulfotelmatobacter sp.]|nr:hypothetical protein [Candidatus Sulfotelmatobacter sp.]